MGIEDDLKGSFGDGFFEPRGERPTAHVWRELCVCGHLDRYHSPSAGGTYRVPEDETVVRRDEDWVIRQVFFGCVGALKPFRGPDEIVWEFDRDAHVQLGRIDPTCPCDQFRPVAKVDRPNRLFNQRVPADLGDRDRHPFQLGLRAMRTHLLKRKAATPERGGDPSWATAELDRRFTWLDGKRVCGISKCTATDDVWPVFVHDDRSELRCGAHR